MTILDIDEILSADVLDSRDVIERIEELEGMEAAIEDLVAGSGLDDDEREELKDLREFAEEASGYAEDWLHGETIIADSYFTEYAQQLADDIGAIDWNASWPLTYIDWERATDALKQDYTEVTLRGVDFWIR